MAPHTTARISLQELRELCQQVLSYHGFSAPHVEQLTATLMAGQADNCASHGVYRLLGLIRSLKAGKVSPDAEPEVHDQAPAIVRVDARQAFSPLAFKRGLPLLIDKARDCGIAAMAINHCVHFSALWVEIEAITAAGLVGLACNPSHAWVAPAGGRRPAFGTNPFAFGWPRPDRDPFVFDFATSAIARGDIELHRRSGEPIPEGWAIDSDGHPTTDASEALKGAMLAFGGHKGSALAAMIELIAGPLIGDLTSAESKAWDGGVDALPYHGELILALDPARFLGEEAPRHLERAETLFQSIQAQGARLPSERRFAARRQTAADGVELPAQLLADIRVLLEETPGG
ncbi:Ldh family oxidoreductase [Aestuariirhabdus litorea]|uniref:Ldh family oxidoreductase n=1 Tax=Aestuariirhabdus litorea TaxID=2528527 RepID=A0A3P3VJE6_9GAMM|nr:Ldh family oxidoreductase [Aestuariirhabdus litorea]RRJ82830.1 Ldh family oxidoreductase [Aestuariirhabdus litorea]RWW92989.1 Ldh family oxidoreductase [Endozoicomonadaceae bacterium GTF-13]